MTKKKDKKELETSTPNLFEVKIKLDEKQKSKLLSQEIMGEILKEIDISDLPNGIYNVRILTKDKTLSTHKLIKE